MANKIDSTTPQYLPVNGHASTAKARSDAEPAAAPRGDAQTGGADTIQLTDSARQLVALEKAVAASSGFDTSRVDALRSQIEDGSYSVTPQQVADTMLRLDQALPEGH